MTSEEALRIMGVTQGDYTQKHRILRGLTILAKYIDNLDTDTAFEHDQIYAGDFEATVAQMSLEEVTEMAQCGWFESEDSWSHF